MQEVTVLGIGNILLGDEGIGVKVVERLEQEFEVPSHVEIVDGGTSGLDLLPYIKKGSILIIVDAAITGGGPGSIIRLEDAEIPAFFAKKLSPHQIGLGDLLATVHLIDQSPAKIVLLGIQPKSLDVGLDLTDELKGKVGTMLEMITEELKRVGVSIKRKAG